MKVSVVSNNNWLQVKQLAFRTIGKETEKEPTPRWKTKMLLCQHSPIRSLVLTITLADIPYWVSVHLTRHKIGCEHYVQTQRTDRTGIDRDELPQGALVTHTMVINAESVINVSRKRLCYQASKETREIWEEVVEQLWDIEPELASVCKMDCIYRGKCFEFKSCGYDCTNEFANRRYGYEQLNVED